MFKFLIFLPKLYDFEHFYTDDCLTLIIRIAKKINNNKLLESRPTLRIIRLRQLLLLFRILLRLLFRHPMPDQRHLHCSGSSHIART